MKFLPRSLLFSAFLLPIFFSLAAAAQERGSASASIIAITDVNVIDVEAGVRRPGMTVVIKGDKISAIADGSKMVLPKNAAVVRASGKFLIPGLWDMHVHVDDAGSWMFPLFIANGVVGMRDMGSTLEQVAVWRKMRQGHELMPDVIASGPIVSGKIADPDARMLLVGTALEAKKAVDRLAAAGADTVKVHDWISRESYFELASSARRRKLPLAGHQPVSMTADEVSNAGQKSIEHFGNTWGGMMIDCSSDEMNLRRTAQELIPLTREEFSPPKLIEKLGNSWMARLADTFDPIKCRRLARKFTVNGTWLDPTIYGAAYAWTFVTEREIASDPRLKFMPAAAQNAARGAAVEAQPTKSADVRAAEKRFYKAQLSLVRIMSDAGVGILAGTDALPFPPLYPGFSLHDELEKLVEAGLTPAQALRAATVNPAKFLGRERRSGRVLNGMTADLVLLDADPLEAIANTRKISAVVLRGRLLDRAMLDKLLSEVERANKL